MFPKSTSKQVFLIMALSASIGFFAGILSENNFMILVGAAFTFYFSNKGDGGNTGEPFLGK